MDNQLFAIRIGCLQLLNKAGTEHPSKPADELTSRISREITRRIRESPIVVEEPQGALGEGHWNSMKIFGHDPATRWSVEFRGHLSFKVHWPRKNQELFRYSGHCFEDFALTYDGEIYTIAVQCEDLIDRPYSFDFGREGYRILASILAPTNEPDRNLIVASGELWDLHIVGPCPMYPIFYVALVEVPANFSTGRELIQEGDTLESLAVLPHTDGGNPDEVIEDILENLRFPSKMHYGAMLVRHEFLDEQMNLYDQFEKATSLYKDVVKALPLDPRKWPERIGNNRKLRESVGLAYTHYAELEEARAAASAAARDTADAFSRNPLLQPHRMYTADHLDDVFELNIHHLMEGLRFFGEESRSRGIELATLGGPLIGGIIAIGATVLVLLVT